MDRGGHISFAKKNDAEKFDGLNHDKRFIVVRRYSGPLQCPSSFRLLRTHTPWADHSRVHFYCIVLFLWFFIVLAESLSWLKTRTRREEGEASSTFPSFWPEKSILRDWSPFFLYPRCFYSILYRYWLWSIQCYTYFAFVSAEINKKKDEKNYFHSTFACVGRSVCLLLRPVCMHFDADAFQK